MEIRFHKYHGAGNDFVIIDNREGLIRLAETQVAALCHRRFGIGADGLMLLEQASDADFAMVYYNADGRESTMCGNGGRCIAAFAHRLGIVDRDLCFRAVDGLHRALVLDDGQVALHMQDVDQVAFSGDNAVLDTGSPHYVQWVDDLDTMDVFGTGRAIRNRPEFLPGGINVNFVKRTGEGIAIRTYERGVEDETLACGTGVTAAAIVAAGVACGHFNIPVEAMGGRLSVSFRKDKPGTACDIILTGGAAFVFDGSITLP